MTPVAANFRNKYKLCTLCNLEFDNQPHLISCFMIRGYSKTLLFNESEVNYEAIFSDDITRQKEITKVFYSALKTRDLVLNTLQNVSS